MIDRLDVRMFVLALPEKLAMKIAWLLPRKLVYWCALRAVAQVTSGQFGTDHPDDVSVMDMLKRIEGWA